MNESAAADAVFIPPRIAYMQTLEDVCLCLFGEMVYQPSDLANLAAFAPSTALDEVIPAYLAILTE